MLNSLTEPVHDLRLPGCRKGRLAQQQTTFGSNLSQNVSGIKRKFLPNATKSIKRYSLRCREVSVDVDKFVSKNLAMSMGSRSDILTAAGTGMQLRTPRGGLIFWQNCNMLLVNAAPSKYRNKMWADSEDRLLHFTFTGFSWELPLLGFNISWDGEGTSASYITKVDKNYSRPNLLFSRLPKGPYVFLGRLEAVQWEVLSISKCQDGKFGKRKEHSAPLEKEAMRDTLESAGDSSKSCEKSSLLLQIEWRLNDTSAVLSGEAQARPVVARMLAITRRLYQDK
eukprot:gnl/MRDRNA2_/MRDRNA2_166455_c0_seq1.p1 gnl/MRDRNA2_/MRDRNA2_166455_c0~~gnl/MRDRNA2_/MRDRNA2_166455_c0_seq1.p1  ORF type:complete len:282 (+),score=31.09 gnl/MRDRNA2_/MRDRNA2_166455_c0_seq1:3-848(+)